MFVINLYSTINKYYILFYSILLFTKFSKYAEAPKLGGKINILSHDRWQSEALIHTVDVKNPIETELSIRYKRYTSYKKLYLESVTKQH